MHHEARRKRTRGREDKEDIDKEEEDKGGRESTRRGGHKGWFLRVSSECMCIQNILEYYKRGEGRTRRKRRGGREDEERRARGMVLKGQF